MRATLTRRETHEQFARGVKDANESRSRSRPSKHTCSPPAPPRARGTRAAKPLSVPMPSSHSSDRSSGLLVAIGIFKLVKCAALIVTGILALRLVHDGDTSATVVRWLEELRVDPGNRLLHGLLARVAHVNSHRLEVTGIGTFAYAALFAVEGVGLVLRKRWAEWFTIFVTGSFVPLEIYELANRFTVVRLAILLLNLAVVAYLVARRVHDHARSAQPDALA